MDHYLNGYTWVWCMHYPIQLHKPARTCLVTFLQLQAATILGMWGKNFQNAFFWNYVVLFFLLLFFQCLACCFFFFFNSCSQYYIIKPDVLPEPDNFAFFSHCLISEPNGEWWVKVINNKIILIWSAVNGIFGKVFFQCF